MTAMLVASFALLIALIDAVTPDVAARLAEHRADHARARRRANLVRRRFVVTLKGNEGDFSGVLTEVDVEVFVFEQCATVPANLREGTPTEIPGRIFVQRSNVAYLQEVSL